MNAVSLSRRSLFRTAAGLVVAVSLPRAGSAQGVAKTLDRSRIDAFLAIGPDGSVTLYSGKVDLGTGARAAFRQLVAEELRVSPTKIVLVEGDSATTPDQGPTAGSTGITVGGMEFRRAAASAREALIALAAEHLKLPAADLEAVDGAVRPRAGGAAVEYAALVRTGRIEATLDANVRLTPPDEWRYLGKSMARPDLPAKLTGRHTYVHDFRLPNMLHGRVIRQPCVGAELVSVDIASITDIPGIVRVVRMRNFLGVVARTEWGAMRAAKALSVTWKETPSLPGSDKLAAHVRGTEILRGEVIAERGNAADALSGANVLKATYYWPAQAHASMGPSCAVADMREDGGTIWSASQATHRLARNFPALLGMKPGSIAVNYLDGAGCYGTNGHDDVSLDAAILSRAARQPVRVQWSREDELVWEPKGPPQVLDLRGAVAKGRIAAWETRTWLPANTPNLPSIPLIAGDAAGLDQKQGHSAGLMAGNCDPPYEVPALRAVAHWVKSTPLRSSNLRAPGKVGNVFAVESFTDELAAAAGADPLAFRLAQLKQARGHDVLRRVADMMGWEARPSPASRTRGAVMKGRGLAYCHYKQAENFVALGAEVEVERNGALRVVRMVCAHDGGMSVNPDAVRAQVEGNILQTLSRTLFEEVVFDTMRVTSSDWASYPILRFTDLPKIEIELMDRAHDRPFGAGEAASAPVGAAVGNAIFDATGVRLREAPFTEARLKAALAGA